MRSYVPSGRVSLQGLLITVPVALLVCALAGWIYQRCLPLIPWCQLAFLATVLLGAVVGAIGWVAVKTSRCRSLALARGMAVVFGLWTVGVTHVVAFGYWREELAKAVLQSMKDDPDPEVAAAAPDEVSTNLDFSTCLKIRREAGWEISRYGSPTEVSGFSVILLWFLEAAAVVAMAFYVSAFAAREPFCEGCGAWMEPKEIGSICDVAGSRLEQAAGQSLALLFDPPRLSGSGKELRYTLYTCRGRHPVRKAPAYLKCEMVWTDVLEAKKQTHRKTIASAAMVASEDVPRLVEFVKSGGRQSPTKQDKNPETEARRKGVASEPAMPS